MIATGDVGLAVSIINRRAGAYFRESLKKFSLGPGQQAYLLALRPGEKIPQDTLSQRLCVDKANVTRAVTGLTELGYLRRERDMYDKRIWNVSLSEQGTAVQKEVREISRLWIEMLRSYVDCEEWTVTEQTLKKIAESLQDCCENCC
ncbi:MAG: MarR family winged helix-turn-helix transcriptional regulator [Spirochaetia bacterium]